MDPDSVKNKSDWTGQIKSCKTFRTFKQKFNFWNFL